MVLNVKMRALVLFVLLSPVAADEKFSEELLIKPLPSGHIYLHFQFTTTLNNPPEHMNFYRLFPMTVGELIQTNSVEEFHLSLTQGKWSHENWGYPIKDRPAGAILWTWFKDNPDTNWKKFAAALGGMTCSSLNFVDDTITVTPKYVFQPEGHIEHLNATNLRLSMLPGEAVCTENLTPWLKILPCTNAGFSQLLKTTSIFSSHYTSIGMDVKRVCLDDDCNQLALLLQQYMTIVLDTTIASGKQDWSFLSLFQKPLTSVCPLSSKSKIFVDISSNGVSAPFELNPPPHAIEKKGNLDYAVYDAQRLAAENKETSIIGSYRKNHVYWPIKPPPITVNRYVQGYGLQQGGIRAVITNNDYTPLNVTYLEVVPWFLRVYVHTLTITSNGQRTFPTRIVFQPSLDREKPCHLEIGLKLAPRSKTEIFFSFERAFLAWTEYPPDPHLGFYIGAASVTIALPKEGLANFTGDISTSETLELALLEPSGQQAEFLVIFSEILLVTLPTPDFSMPYNVICFVCTALALAFGPIHNVTTKNLTLQDKAQKKGLVQRVLQKLKGVSSKKAKKD